jgi:hypothetical protein
MIFMSDNLCMDTFIRSYMDVEGYVPIALVCSYPNVAYYQAPQANIITRLQETAGTSRLEVDARNETVRLKDGWDMWLIPNQTGTKGVPRYIKQHVAPEDAGEEGGTDGAAAAGDGNGAVEIVPLAQFSAEGAHDAFAAPVATDATASDAAAATAEK